MNLLPTKNNLRAQEAFAALDGRKERGLASILFLHGPAGTGKTEFGRWLVQPDPEGVPRGAFVRALRVWTGRAMTLDILRALAPRCMIRPHTGWGLYLRLCDELRNEARWPEPPILVIDEADYLDTRGGELLDILRDLYDETPMRLVLISVRSLVTRFERGTPSSEIFCTRIGCETRFEKIDLADAELFARELSVKLDRPLVQHCLEEAGGSIRPLLSIFDEVEKLAKRAHERSLTLATWERLAKLSRIRTMRSIAAVPKVSSAVELAEEIAGSNDPEKAKVA